MANKLRNYTFKLAVGEKVNLGLRGDTLRVITASVDLFFETKDGSSAFYLQEGEQAQFNEAIFTDIDIYHNDASEQTVVIAVGEGAQIGSTKVSGNVTITNLINNGAATQTRVSLTNVNQQVLAANTSRKYLLIQNNDAAAVMRITLDGNAATAAQGFRVAAGSSLELSNFNVTGAINVIMETATGAADNVEIAEA